MKFAKKATIKNLQNLEDAIMARRDMFKHEPDVKDLDAFFTSIEATDDLMFVRGLMDDIECGRITEMEVN